MGRRGLSKEFQVPFGLVQGRLRVELHKNCMAVSLNCGLEKWVRAPLKEFEVDADKS